MDKEDLKQEVKRYMRLPYTIELMQESDGTYFVKVKELQGCMSAGDTPNEAVEMIHDAMRGWMEVAIKNNMKVPTPGVAEEVDSG